MKTPHYCFVIGFLSVLSCDQHGAVTTQDPIGIRADRADIADKDIITIVTDNSIPDGGKLRVQIRLNKGDGFREFNAVLIGPNASASFEAPATKKYTLKEGVGVRKEFPGDVIVKDGPKKVRVMGVDKDVWEITLSFQARKEDRDRSIASSQDNVGDVCSLDDLPDADIQMVSCAEMPVTCLSTVLFCDAND